MRFLIISDLHANLEALEAVLEAAPRSDYDRLLVLGDLVGYGANPNEVVESVYALAPEVLIRGNHDKVACGVEAPTNFNEVAAEAARWTYQTLTPENRERIAALPAGPTLVDEHVEVCHGTPYDEDVYVFDADDAYRALQSASRPLCFFGHTHVAIAYIEFSDSLSVIVPRLGALEATAVPLDEGRKYLVNPGSVGQPRDGDPRAGFAVYDSDRREVRLHRVAYRVDVAQRKIAAAGLPQVLARRLAVGR